MREVTIKAIFLRFMVLALALTSTLVTVGGAKAAGGPDLATFSLDPASGSYLAGSTISFTIHENSGSDQVNAVEADLTYDQGKLQFLSASISGGAFTIGPTPSGGNGSVTIAAGSTTNRTGDQVVATVSFKALALTGGSSVSFASSSAIVRASDTANIWDGNTAGGTYIVAPTTKSQTQLLADVTGDPQHKADAVVVFRDTGLAMVAASTGSSFSTPVAWAQDPRIAGADKYFLGDVNADGKADLVGFWNTGGYWKVMLSTGTGFQGPPVLWAANQGIGTAKQWLADVNGDSRADTMTFDPGSGDWWASLSTGTGFGPNQQRWSQGNGVGSTDQFVTDFTGDGKADLGIYIAGNGSWYITPSGTTPPFGYSAWAFGHGQGSGKRFVGDVNGDGKTDEAFFFPNVGHWDNGMSAGNGFFAPTAWAHGQGVGTAEQFLADATGDGKADLVTFDPGSGDWHVGVSSGSGFWAPVRWVSGHGKVS